MATQEYLIERLEHVLTQLKQADLTPAELRRAYRKVWGTERIVIEQVEPARLLAIESRLEYLISKSEQSVCHFRDESIQETDVVQFLVSRGNKGREQGNNKLARWLKDATKIIIVDPYLLDPGSYKNALSYCNAFKTIIPPSVRQLELFYNPAHLNKEVASKLSSTFQVKNISQRYVASKSIHDRVWIKVCKDNRTSLAKVVGCSFHNLGNKPTYIIDLPPSDLDEYLKDLKHVRETSNIGHHFEFD